MKGIHTLLPLLLAIGCGKEEPNDSTQDTPDTAVDSCGVELEFVRLDAGSFTMGSHEAEPGRNDDELAHQVTLTRAFHIGATEVTQAAFRALMGYDNSNNPECKRCPVDEVSWNEAAYFANLMSDCRDLQRCYVCSGELPDADCKLKEAFDSPYDCRGFRLPTEAEWEYAARAGTSASFSNGGDLNDGNEDMCEGNLPLDDGSLVDSFAWYCGNATTTQPVGEKLPNAWGLYDMHGSVWEWCEDIYIDYPEGPVTDPVGYDPQPRLVKRGGSWDTQARILRSANRLWQRQDYRDDTVGFRLVRTAPNNE